jgi:tyrosyl-tRNA synthetase
MESIIDCLRDRGLIDDLTDETSLIELLKTPTRLYCGFDPSADSLHLGNLLCIVVLKWFEKWGHLPCVILGGATGRIGDPSGKSQERPLLDEKIIDRNILEIEKTFRALLADFLLFNNNDWFSDVSLIDFLRDIGKHFRVNGMLAKESVRSRLEQEQGISFTEFSYQLLQAYDFLFLYTHHQVLLQIGGSDQWGNITAGIDLIRKVKGKAAFGLTLPLLTRSDGRKFGKTEEGAIWLSPEKCSPYQFYQYLVQVPDGDVIRLMRCLTFMDMGTIREWERRMQDPHYIPNSAQKCLAKQVTEWIHGLEGLEKALRVTETALPGKKAPLTAEGLLAIASDIPYRELLKREVINQKIADFLVQAEIFSSKGEAIRLIHNGGLSLNEEKVEDPLKRIEEKDFIGQQFLLVSVGKKKKILIKVLSENQ